MDDNELVEFFDELIERSAGIQEILRTTAQRVGCVVGLRTADGIFDNSAAPATGVSKDGEPCRRLTRTFHGGGEVWIAWHSGSRVPEELLLRRLSTACAVALREARSRLPKLDDPALIELIIGEETDLPDRARALALLGYSTTTPLRIIAITGHDEDVRQVLAQLDDVHAVALGPVYAAITPDEVPTDISVPIGTRIGAGLRLPGAQAGRSWRTTCAALRFALPSTHPSPPYPVDEAVVVDAADLGCFTLLAQHLPADSLTETEEITVLDRLASEPGGREMLRTLEAVAATESLRRAATTLHMHHNSVRSRVSRAEQLLGFTITAPYGRVRLMLALVLRRLRESAHH